MTITAMELIEELKKLDPRAPIRIKHPNGLSDIVGFYAYPNPVVVADDKLPTKRIVCQECQEENYG